MNHVNVVGVPAFEVPSRMMVCVPLGIACGRGRTVWIDPELGTSKDPSVTGFE
jgi:hypothetical protein